MNRMPGHLGLNLLITCFLLSGGGNAAADENWTSFRGPTDQGHSSATDLPIHWGESENVAWKTAIAGKAWSSPVIWGDRIWITGAPEDGSNLFAICVDKNSGKIIHNKNLHYVVAPQYCHPFNSYGSPSPVIEEGRVYVSFGSPYNACLDTQTGEVIWERTDFVCNHFRGPGSSPFLYKNLLIIHFDGSDRQYVVAMDKKTGKTVWEMKRSVDFQDIDPKTGQPNRQGDYRKAFSTPLIVDVAGKPIMISLGSKAVYAYEPETGKEIWRLDAPQSHSAGCRPITGHGLVYVPIGSGVELWAIRPGGSGVLSMEEDVAWTYSRGAVPRRASPLLVGDLIFMVNDNGVAGCVDAHTGKEIWRKRLGNNFSASPIDAAGRVYFFDQKGKSTVIEASRKYRVLATNHLDEGLMASPAVTGAALILRTRTHLYRIEAK